MFGPERTVYRSTRVGSGIGPCTSLCVRLAVSTISWALWSRIAWSYASIRIRITSFVAATSLLLHNLWHSNLLALAGTEFGSNYCAGRKANITRIGHFDNPPEAQNSRQLLPRDCV